MSSVGYGPLWRIDGPLPLPPTHGLLAAAAAPAAGVRIVTDVETQPDGTGIERWGSGVEVYPYPPDQAQIRDACAAGTSAGDKQFGTAFLDSTRPQFSAITVYLAETCTSYRVWDQDRFKARAVVALEAVESAALARHFMNGEGLTLNPHLADGNGVFPNVDVATKPQNALQLLEEQIALSGKQGVVHCSPMLASALMGSGFALSDKTGVIRTINGIVVVPDFGYAAGSTPAGHAAATGQQEWMYATGPVDVYRTEVFTLPDNVSEALDRGSGGATKNRPNSITYRAERYYLAVWDRNVQAAVLADRCSTTC